MKDINKIEKINRYTKKIITKNGIHIGQTTFLTNKKINRYILGSRNNVEIFNLENTKYFIMKLSLLFSVLCQTAEKPTLKVLFATTSTPYSKIVKDAAISCGMLYAVQRWSTGWLTSTKNYNKKKITWRLEDTGNFSNNHKTFLRQFGKTIDINKIKKNKKLIRQPALVIIPDISNNLMILHEADQMNIPVISLLNTSSNKLVDYPLLGNDRSIIVNYFFCNLLATLINNNNNSQEYRSLIKTKRFNKVIQTSKKKNRLTFEKSKLKVKKFFWQFMHNYIFLRKAGKKDVVRVFRNLFPTDYSDKQSKHYRVGSLAFFSNLLTNNMKNYRLTNNLLLNSSNSVLKYQNIWKMARTGRLFKLRKAYKVIRKKWWDWKYFGKSEHLNEKWNPRYFKWSSFISYYLKHKPTVMHEPDLSWWLKPWRPWANKNNRRNKYKNNNKQINRLKNLKSNKNKNKKIITNKKTISVLPINKKKINEKTYQTKK